MPLPLIVPPQFTRVLAIFFICHTLGLLAYILPQVRKRCWCWCRCPSLCHPSSPVSLAFFIICDTLGLLAYILPQVRRRCWCHCPSLCCPSSPLS